MRLGQTLMGAVALTVVAAPSAAELPMPPQAAATQQATAYLFHAGAGDVYEVTSSLLAVQHAADPAVRAFATKLIADHTLTTNAALAAATSAGVMPPPPILSPEQMAMIGQLTAAGANFDRVYLQQQLTAHEQALALQRGYASNGDVPALRNAAATAAPVIEGHLAHVQELMRAAR